MLGDPLVSYFGENIRKLSKIKKKYDPEDFFSTPQSIHGA